MKHDFKIKRRRLLVDNNIPSYKKVVLLYKKAIESKLEDNLKIIANKVIINISFSYSVSYQYFIVKNKNRRCRGSLRKALLKCRFDFRFGYQGFLKALASILVEWCESNRNLPRN